MTEIKEARTKLEDVLQDLVDKPDESISGSIAHGKDAPKTGAPSTVNTRKHIDTGTSTTLPALLTDSPIKHFTSRPIKKRKRRHSDGEQQIFKHTYVMKLFDRSVDLAQFITDDTSLYVVCRAWMRNKPHVRESTHSHRHNSEDELVDIETDTQPLSPSSHSTHRHHMSHSDVTRQKNARIPSPVPKQKLDFDVEVNKDVQPDKQTLFADHMSRWKTTRTKWQKASRLNEEKFGESLKMLRTLANC